ncbi:MAG: hypothetical protein NDI77_13960 [Geobacteraceae bacterium]|nr:hypothetical protein [Geobacteraceae bacterium]
MLLPLRVALAPLLFIAALASSAVGSAEGRFGPDPMMIVYCSSEQLGFNGEVVAPLQLLQRKEIADELGLTGSQLDNIKEADQQFNAGLKEWLDKQAGSAAFSQQRKEKAGGLDMDIAKQVGETRKKVAEILKQGQLRRMRSISLQMYGLWVIPIKDMQELLRLTTTQEAKLDGIRAQLFRKINDASDAPVKPSSPVQCKIVAVNNEKIRSLVVQSERAAYEILSPEQKETLEKMKGKPFRP